MIPSIEKSRHPGAPWKRDLAKYRRLAACMIEESAGYFTPHAAILAITAQKKGVYWGCEWYMDIDAKRHDNKIRWNDPDYDDRIKAINRDVISDAFKNRKYYRSKAARQIVEANIDGYDSVLASWF